MSFSQAKLASPGEAAASIPDGATITISGTIGYMLPIPVLDAIERRFLETGHPRDLTWFDVFSHGPRRHRAACS